MNILLTTGIFPPDVGGPATYVPQVATALAERGHLVNVVTLSDGGNHNDTVFTFRIMRIPRRIFKPLRWIRTCIKLITLGRKADILFVNGLAMEAALANVVLNKPMVQKVVGDLAWEYSMNHGLIKDDFEGFQGKRYGFTIEILRYLRKWWTNQSDKIIVPSNYLRDCVANWGVERERISVIYNSVEKNDDIFPAHVPLKTSFKLVTVGRLVEWKHIDEIIGLLVRLRDTGLVVVGEGPEYSKLKLFAADQGVAERVYFAGKCGQKETFALLAACDLFILNSSYEGLPHVLIEAMKLGLPVVATSVGGTTEVIRDGENGLLIDLHDDSLVNTICHLIGDRNFLKHLSENGKLTVEEKFNSHRMINGLESVLQSLQ
jgi:glycosyltransferase involved in cell wall biosynthesis